MVTLLLVMFLCVSIWHLGWSHIPIGLGVCLILTGAFYGKKLNKMSMLTLPDFYYRRFGAGAEGISEIYDD